MDEVGWETWLTRLARNTSLTTLYLTINNRKEHGTSEDWARQLGDGLANSKSLTALTLRLNNESFVTEDEMKDLRKGLAKSTSLHAVTVIVNGNSYRGEELTSCLGHSSAKRSSSPLVASCNDSKHSQKQKLEKTADLEECALVPFRGAPFELKVPELMKNKRMEKL